MKGNGELSNLGEMGGEGEMDTCRVEMFWVYSFFFFFFSFYANLDVAGGGKKQGNWNWDSLPPLFWFFQLLLLFLVGLLSLSFYTVDYVCLFFVECWIVEWMAEIGWF